MGRKNPGMRRPPKAGSGGGWRMHIPLMAVQLLCGRLLTSPSSHVTTFPSQKGQPGTPRSVKLEWPGLVSLSRGHLSSVHLSVCPLLVTDLVWWCCSEQRARGRKEWPETQMGSEWQGFESFLKLHQKKSALRTAQKQLCLHDATHLGQPAPG